MKVLSRLFRGKYQNHLKDIWAQKKLKFYGSSEAYRNHYDFKELLNTCYREEGYWKELTLPGIEFIRRFLMHVPPKRFVRIRHYGLLCTRSKTKHLTLCRNLLGCKQYLSRLRDMETPQILETLYGINVSVCKCCGGHLGKLQKHTHLRI